MLTALFCPRRFLENTKLVGCGKSPSNGFLGNFRIGDCAKLPVDRRLAERGNSSRPTGSFHFLSLWTGCRDHVLLLHLSFSFPPYSKLLGGKCLTHYGTKGYVHQGKQFNHAKEIFAMNEFLSPSQIGQIESAYKETRQKYQEVLCKRCGTTRTRLSWSELDLLSMAREAGIDKLYLRCYYDPTLQAHTTSSSLSSRLRIKENGQVTFDEGAQHEKADVALMGAHRGILYVVDTENSYFKMALENEIQERFADVKYVWETE
jgi:hypothetical protein